MARFRGAAGARFLTVGLQKLAFAWGARPALPLLLRARLALPALPPCDRSAGRLSPLPDGRAQPPGPRLLSDQAEPVLRSRIGVGGRRSRLFRRIV